MAIMALQPRTAIFLFFLACLLVSAIRAFGLLMPTQITEIFQTNIIIVESASYVYRFDNTVIILKSRKCQALKVTPLEVFHVRI